MLASVLQPLGKAGWSRSIIGVFTGDLATKWEGKKHRMSILRRPCYECRGGLFSFAERPLDRGFDDLPRPSASKRENASASKAGSVRE